MRLQNRPSPDPSRKREGGNLRRKLRLNHPGQTKRPALRRQIGDVFVLHPVERADRAIGVAFIEQPAAKMALACFGEDLAHEDRLELTRGLGQPLAAIALASR